MVLQWDLAQSSVSIPHNETLKDREQMVRTFSQITTCRTFLVVQGVGVAGSIPGGGTKITQALLANFFLSFFSPYLAVFHM